MPDWQAYLAVARAQLARIPWFGWVAAGTVAVSLVFALYFEMSGPPYAVLYDGLAPADGGKVIAQLQKLGIPYQLAGAGNVISVPAPQLAEARLQLATLQVPESSTSSAWDKLEDAPMTASDLAQDTMATQALEASLEQSIETLDGISSAQVYLALPQETPFLADQPKPTASVVIAADQMAAATQGTAIANLVAGAVPGLAPKGVRVETTSGVTVYPTTRLASTSSQFTIVNTVESQAAERVAMLLGPLVGEGHFRTGISADVDFTREHIHSLSYGPTRLVSHDISDQRTQSGITAPAIGIPGALSNEPPAATVAAPPPAPAAGGAPGAPPANPAPATARNPQTAPPQQVSRRVDQTYMVDQSESDITKPDWVVSSIAVSVVLDQAALGKISIEQVKAAIAGAFAYQHVSVNVLAAPFAHSSLIQQPMPLQQAIGPVSRAVLEVLAAVALLFGVALPVGRRIDAARTARRTIAIASPRPVEVAAIAPLELDFMELRNQANRNVSAVAKLLQSWSEEGE